MIVPKQKVELAVGSNDGSRWQIRLVKYDVENKQLIAADGFILASIPVEPSASDKSCLLQPEILTIAREHEMNVSTSESGAHVHSIGEFITFPVSDYPDESKVVEQAASAKHIFTLNMNLLNRLTEVFDCQLVKFYYSPSSDGKVAPILIRPVDSEEAFGIIMPAHVCGVYSDAGEYNAEDVLDEVLAIAENAMYAMVDGNESDEPVSTDVIAEWLGLILQTIQ